MWSRVILKINLFFTSSQLSLFGYYITKSTYYFKSGTSYIMRLVAMKKNKELIKGVCSDVNKQQSNHSQYTF